MPRPTFSITPSMSTLLLLILSTLQALNALSLSTSPIKNAPFSFPSLSSIFSPLKQPSASSSSIGNPTLENALIDAISSTTTTSSSRLSNSETILSLINQLERTPSLSSPATSPQIYGRWKLIHTTNTDTSSPIQRKAVDASQFDIYQDILVRPKNDDDGDDEMEELVVSQVVTFGEGKELVVDALASTSAYPLEELTERTSTGKILGLNLLGVSLVGDEAKVDPERQDARIDFVFDEGNFSFGDWKIPYPVPFRSPLFRDWVKGWIDITYLSDRMRISRGNKGTTFVLIKQDN